MTQGANNIWKAGKILNAGQGENEFVSLIRPASPATAPAPTAAPSDAYALANRPSHVISQGQTERPNSSILAGNPLHKLRNS